MEVTYFFRARVPGVHSIESVFEPIAQKIRGAQCVYVPFNGTSPVSILKNILFARSKQTRINHVTGDVHYLLQGFSRRSKNILTIHDCGVLLDKSKPAWKRLALRYFWFKWPIQIADGVTTISEKSKAELVQNIHCAPSKIVVIPNFVNPAFVFSRKEFNTARPRLLQIGSTENKNLARVIQAISGIPCDLTIVGSVTNTEQQLLVQHRISYELKKGISFEDILEEYRKADVVLFVSTYEGFGLPIVEAQATGRVVITSDISPCREVAGEGAICVNPLNISEIREALLQVIKDENLRSLTIEAGLKNVKQYSLDKVVEQYLDVYQN